MTAKRLQGNLLAISLALFRKVGTHAQIRVLSGQVMGGHNPGYYFLERRRNLDSRANPPPNTSRDAGSGAAV